MAVRLTREDAPGLLRRMVPGPLHCRWDYCVHSWSSPFALHRAALVRGPGQVVPSEDHSHWPPAVAAPFGERAKSPKQKNMNTTNQNNTAAPSVTIAPRNPVKGVLNFVVTLTTHKTSAPTPAAPWRVRSSWSSVLLPASPSSPAPPPRRPKPTRTSTTARAHRRTSGRISQTSLAQAGDLVPSTRLCRAVGAFPAKAEQVVTFCVLLLGIIHAAPR